MAPNHTTTGRLAGSGDRRQEFPAAFPPCRQGGKVAFRALQGLKEGRQAKRARGQGLQGVASSMHILILSS
jgi:hypothetical protein